MEPPAAFSIRPGGVYETRGDSTIYEIGYARALNKPVVFYVENESAQDRKMMEGSDCLITDDYVSAIYQMTWAAVEL